MFGRIKNTIKTIATCGAVPKTSKHTFCPAGGATPGATMNEKLVSEATDFFKKMDEWHTRNMNRFIDDAIEDSKAAIKRCNEILEIA